MGTKITEPFCNEIKMEMENRLLNDKKSLGLFKWPTLNKHQEIENRHMDMPTLKNAFTGNNSNGSSGHLLADKHHWFEKDNEKNTSNKITEEVHKRLQEQLAMKQREVQDIQQKIAKNKKWGDHRKGPSDKYRHFPKPPMVRPFPCPPANFQVFDSDPSKRRKRERVDERESNLDPNSPCFYPSQTAPLNPTYDGRSFENGHNPVNGSQFESESDNTFHPFYPCEELPIKTGYAKFLSASNSMNKNKKAQLINNMLGFRGNSMERKFGAPKHIYLQPRWGGGRHRDIVQKLPTNGNDRFLTKAPNYCENENKMTSIFLTTRFDINQQSEDSSNSYDESKSLSPYSHDSSRGIHYSKYGSIGSNPTSTDSSEDNSLKESYKFDKHSKIIVEESRYSDATDHHKDAPNLTSKVFNPSRLRIVRKRKPEINKAWKADECQPISSDINCPSCKLRYRWPHVMSCCHSFCFSCLVKNLDKTQGRIKCPTCSTETELTGNNIEGLQLDFLRCKIMHAKQVNPFSCMACSMDKHATSYCQECMQYMCPDCKRFHEINADFSTHNVSDVKKVKEVESQYVETCSEHPNKTLENYCEECKTLVCIECTAFGQLHSDHQVGNMTKLYPMAANKIKTMSAQLDRMRNEVQKRVQPLTLLKQDIETSIRFCKQEIHKYSNSLLAETEKCRSKARLLIDKIHEDFAEEIEIAQDHMVEYLSEYSPLIDFFRRYFFLGSPQEFMSLASTIQGKILKMKSKHDELQQYENVFAANVSFKADYAGMNEYLQNQYSRIRITENLSDALPSESSELGRRIDQDIIAAIQRYSTVYSPSTSGSSADNDFKANPSFLAENIDPQSEMFNYNRTSISYMHEFGKYGRGEYEFIEPSGVLYLLDGSLAVCDTANHRIMVYDNNFNYVRTIGQPPNLPPLREKKEHESRNERHLPRTPNCLYFPYRIAQCPQTDNIVVIERPPSRDIQIFSVFGQFITSFGSDILQHPRGVAVDEHGVIVTVEGRTMKLMLFSQEGKLLHRFYLSVHLEFPNDVAARDGLIYISDNRGHCVHVFDYNAEPKHTIGNESVTYYPIGVSLTHLNQVVVTDNHNTFNISIFDALDGRYLFGFKSRVRHANCYNVAVHPHRLELAVTSRENQVVIFNFDTSSNENEGGDKTNGGFEN